MYVWIWRHLPGNVALRILQTALLVAGVSALLLFAVFPWAEPRLPFDNVTINTNTSSTTGGGGGGAIIPSK